MKKLPCINAGDLSPEELRIWLNRVADSAGVKTDGLFEIVSCLRRQADELKKPLETIQTKINYLSSPEIIRSADHSNSTQEDLRLLREIQQSVHDFRQSIDSLTVQISETHCWPMLPVDWLNTDPGVSEQEKREYFQGIKTQPQSGHEANE
ncbi:TPA: hypothetical protein LSI07_000222 [Klebsiella oxytoca]|nr:hypothetical protein [Klebsiella oxytoca]